MATRKLSAQFIKKANRPESGRDEYFDTEVRGFGLRITQAGKKSWFVMYRHHGRLRRFTLGTYPEISLSDARGLAREAKGKVMTGIDPAEERKALREPAEQENLLKETVNNFIERYAKPKNRSWKETRRIFDHDIIPRWGKRHVAHITRKDVIKLLDDMVDRGAPVMANRVLAALRKFFNWCLERDIVEANPAGGISPPGDVRSRDRVLTEAEIKKLWEAWDAIGWPFGPYFKLLLITGQRRNEVANMRWEDINPEKSLWTLPREFTKSDRVHEVPLSSLAKDIVASLPNRGPYVFTTTGNTAISGFSKPKKRVDELSGVRDWKLHDLRRTAASGMAKLNVAPHVVEKILNHQTGSISGVAAVYNRYAYQPERREALVKWADLLESLIV